MIEIVPYDPAWAAAFAELRSRLSGPLSGVASRIEHVGSTAVPGLAAKPVLDVTVVVDSVDHLPAVIRRLDPLGYRHLGGAGWDAFATPSGLPAHRLSVWAFDHPTLLSSLAYRDYLRTHPDTVRAYAELKYYLADRFRHDRATYAASKAAFIARIVSVTGNSRTPAAAT
ncbi:GrpB family protein [Kutzneria sp. CA-103260]|uniref:GrpB family protein n=1 Tax=Kutzneria sp. CA-103260 TaxID=2802641 RepID=UPI001BA5223C|nr:GrpB family protein [Kutzneria sp. CA-103260]QUQ65011.1 cyclopropane fatty acid synthase/methyltransferase [Kutzneria sp. CA-103260]